ncbi:MAG: glycosyltransferase family 4 protein [Methanoregulaceae archaeon]|jgi:glycosyltransferase involved in cell wall biosynthesis|nr:glycosyltransferase family 4 protein [Methanoregulaceae archaeon]
MKIMLAVHQFFPYHYTGTERVVLNLSRQLQRMGHDVIVLTYAIDSAEGLYPRGEFLAGKYSFQGIPVIAVRHREPPEDLDFIFRDEGMQALLESVIEDERVDIIHVCHPMRVGSIIPAAIARSIPVIVTLTDFWLLCPKFIAVTRGGIPCDGPRGGKRCAEECYEPSWKYRLRERLQEIERVKNQVSAFVSPTEFLKAIFEGNRYRSLYRIPFGLDYQDVRITEKKYNDESAVVFGYLSTPVRHKGAHILVDAFLRANMQNTSLKLFGDGRADREYYENLRSASNGDPRVEFCGRYRHEDLPSILGSLDVVVIPSLWWENSPLVLLTALACGVPAIVSDLGGLTEYVQNDLNGYAFKAGDVNALAAVIRKIASSPSTLQELRARLTYPARIEEEAVMYENLYQTIWKPGEAPGNVERRRIP